MTFLQTAISQQKLVRIQEKGQVTLPSQIRKKLSLKKGDLIAVMETKEGVLLTPQEIVATKALDRIGQILKEKGVSLEKLIESGREKRGRLIEKQYGIRPGKDK